MEVCFLRKPLSGFVTIVTLGQYSVKWSLCVSIRLQPSSIADHKSEQNIVCILD